MSSSDATEASERGLAFDTPSFRATPLPAAAAAELRPDHPRLLELRARYARIGGAVTDHVSWTERYLRDELDLRHFRGDNAFVWQLRGLRDQELAALKYALTTYYVQSIDSLGLLGRLEEDGLFGVHLFDVNRRTVSRDLLDSVNEILFLERLGAGQVIRQNHIGARQMSYTHQA